MAIIIKAQGYAIRRKTDGAFITGTRGHFGPVPRLFASMKDVKQHLNQYCWANYRAIYIHKEYLIDCELIDVATEQVIDYDLVDHIQRKIESLKIRLKGNVKVIELISRGDGSFDRKEIINAEN